MPDDNSIYFIAFCVVNVLVLKEVNQNVLEPYMVRGRRLYDNHLTGY